MKLWSVATLKHVNKRRQTFVTPLWPQLLSMKVMDALLLSNMNTCWLLQYEFMPEKRKKKQNRNLMKRKSLLVKDKLAKCWHTKECEWALPSFCFSIYNHNYCQRNWCFVVIEHEWLLTTSTRIHIERKGKRKWTK